MVLLLGKDRIEMLEQGAADRRASDPVWPRARSRAMASAKDWRIHTTHVRLRSEGGPSVCGEVRSGPIPPMVFAMTAKEKEEEENRNTTPNNPHPKFSSNTPCA